ncbi:MAG: WD40 repeat domain-containing protein, partial [Planctomycetia bacterium]|nr:WD40 repeat domain-containing protein [Planctomycetia bacterium]
IKVAVRLLDTTTGKELRRIEGFPDNLPVISLAFHPDGKQLVCGAGFFPSDGPAANVPQPAKNAPALRVVPLNAPAKDAPVNPWRESKVLELHGWLSGSVVYSPDGKTLFVGGTEGYVVAYDTATWKQLWESKDGQRVSALSVAPDGKTVAVTTKDGIQFLDAATGKDGEKLEEKDSAPIAVAFFPDLLGTNVVTRRVIFGDARGYTVKTRREAAEEKPTVSTITSSTVPAGKKPADQYAVPLAVDPDGNRVVVTGPIDKDTGKNVLWAWAAGSKVENKLLEGHKEAVTSAAWSKDGKLILTGDAEGFVITWDAATFKEKSRMSFGGRIVAVAISPDGHHSAAAVVRLIPGVGQGAYAEELFVWGTTTPPKKPEPVSKHRAGAPFTGVASLAFAPDSKSLVSAFCNFTHLARLGELVGKVRVFALEAPKLPPEPEPAGKFITDVSFSPDGKKYLAVTGEKVTVFDSTTGKELYSVAGEAARFTADGKLLVVMGEKEITFFDAEKGQLKTSHARPKTKFAWQRVGFSPDGKRFAAHFGMFAGIYDTATATEAVKLSDRFEMAGYILGNPGKQIAFSPDGKQVVASGVLITKDGVVGAAVWDAQTGKRLQTFAGDADDGPRFAAFNPNKEELAVAFKDRAEVWTIRGDAKKSVVR